MSIIIKFQSLKQYSQNRMKLNFKVISWYIGRCKIYRIKIRKLRISIHNSINKLWIYNKNFQIYKREKIIYKLQLRLRKTAYRISKMKLVKNISIFKMKNKKMNNTRSILKLQIKK